MLVVRGAREHNLQNVSIELPRDRLIVFTGLSGSGKSSLAFDTIYAEGQRRYVESLSSYARQFLGQMDKPDVDFIEGLSPAISIDQKSRLAQPAVDRRHDHRGLRLPPAALRAHRRAALPERRHAGRAPDAPADRRPRARAARTAHASRCSRRSCGDAKESTSRCSPTWRTQGFARGRIDGEVARARRHDVDPEARALRAAHHRGRRRPPREAGRHRAPAHRLAGDGAAAGRGRRRGADRAAGEATTPTPEILTFSQHLACPNVRHGRFDELAPRNFSFNSPYGACEHCDGLGTTFEVDPELVVPNPDLSLDEGAIAPWASGRTQYFSAAARRGRRRRTASTSTCRGRS